MHSLAAHHCTATSLPRNVSQLAFSLQNWYSHCTADITTVSHSSCTKELRLPVVAAGGAPLRNHHTHSAYSLWPPHVLHGRSILTAPRSQMFEALTSHITALCPTRLWPSNARGIRSLSTDLRLRAWHHNLLFHHCFASPHALQIAHASLATLHRAAHSAASHVLPSRFYRLGHALQLQTRSSQPRPSARDHSQCSHAHQHATTPIAAMCNSTRPLTS